MPGPSKGYLYNNNSYVYVLNYYSVAKKHFRKLIFLDEKNAELVRKELKKKGVNIQQINREKYLQKKHSSSLGAKWMDAEEPDTVRRKTIRDAMKTLKKLSLKEEEKAEK
jgi:secreted PhoX family phosphatase